MKKINLSVFFLILSVLVLAMLNFTMYSQKQMYELEQYRLAKVDFEAGNYTEKNQVLDFNNSEIDVSFNKNADMNDGLIITDDEAYHVTNGEKILIDIDKEPNIDSIFEQYLIYYYSFYMSPLMILSYIGFAIAKSIVGIAIIYTAYRVILHKAKRDDIYIKSAKFTDYQFSIATTLLLTNIVYAYSSFFIGYKLPIMSYAVLIVVCYFIVLKSFKKFKR